MIVTVFRSRLRPENADEYKEWAARMSALAKTMPGYISHKVFIAEDGERVSIVEFADEQGQRGWARHEEHVGAKKKGRADFYEESRFQICKVVREMESKRHEARDDEGFPAF